MEIKVERVQEDGKLIFTITCEELKNNVENISLLNHDFDMLFHLEACRDRIAETVPEQYHKRHEVDHAIFTAREQVFQHIYDHFIFALREKLEPKYEHICQEIYNWQYDNAEGKMKQLLQEFDPQRTRYYFDNDDNIENEKEIDPDEVLGHVVDEERDYES
jgi:hypothetical protein